MLQKLFKPRPAVLAGRALYAAAAAQARTPAFYLAGVADTAVGRFELYVLHVVLILHRLKGQGPQAAEVAQAAFDAFVQQLDSALRELGVGDLSVGKKMRKLGEQFYGRVKSYDGALGRLPDREPLSALIARTVLDEGDPAASPLLTDYVARAVEALAATSMDDVEAARLPWPAFSIPVSIIESLDRPGVGA